MTTRATYIIFVCACCVLAATFLTYLVMASLACFVAWTHDYWWIANWDGFSRFLLFAAFCFWAVTGVMTAADYDWNGAP